MERMSRDSAWVIALLLATTGCGDDDGSSASTGGSGGAGGDASGGAGGDGWEGCPAGSVSSVDDTCQPAGVPEDGCGEGFEHQPEGSCLPILPDGACTGFTVALPGEAACREIAPCGAGPYGDIPDEATTHYVDGSYLNVDSDGSVDKPWITITSAIQNAPDGAIVAIAAGSYDEDIILYEKRLRFWGRCPELTKIVGSNAPLYGSVFIEVDADGTELRDLTIESSLSGVIVTGSSDVLLDRVVIRNTADFGLVVSDQLGDASVRLERSLLEATTGAAIITEGGQLSMDRSVVRFTQPFPDQTAGVGLDAQPGSMGGQPSVVSVTGSLLEQNRAVAAFAQGSDLTIVDSVIRDTLPMLADLSSGDGIVVTDDPFTSAPSTLYVSGSYIAHNYESGILVNGADTVIHGTTIVDTRPTEDEGIAGAGIALQPDLALSTATAATVSRSFIKDSASFGIVVAGVDATLSGVVVRSTAGRPKDDGFGDGILVSSSGLPASAVIDGVVVHDSQRAGIATFGAAVDLSGTLLECNAVPINAEDFDGATVSLRDHGGNVCSCDGTDQSCAAQSANLAPPEAVAQ